MKQPITSWRLELIALPLIDAVALGVAFLLSFWLRLGSPWSYDLNPRLSSYALTFILSLPVFWAIFYSIQLYDPHDIFYGTVEYIQVIKGVAFGVLGLIIVGFILHDPALSRGWLLFFWIFATLTVGLARFGLRRVIRPLLQSGRPSERTLVIGASEEAVNVARILAETGRLEVVGFLDDFSPVGEEVWQGITVKGSPQDYGRIAQEMQVSQFILVPGAVTWETYRDIFSETTAGNGLNILVAPRFSGLFSGSLRVSYIGYVPMLRFRPGYTGGLNKAAKTILDLTLGLGILIFCLPAMMIFSIWIYCSKGWPVWEAHKVLGLYGKPFYTYKFRTGLHGENHRYFDQTFLPETAPAGPGKFSLERLLLISGLDKLLQLINVLRGQMSLVGPRNIYETETSNYGVWLPSIIGVKPGMTGPWAIGEVPDLQQEISLTLSYIHTWTPWKDLHILCLTLFYLFQRRLIVRPTGPPEN